VHAIASVRAVENALGMEVPLNAQYIRNLLVIAHALHDHIVQLLPPVRARRVDVVSALKADPKRSAVARGEPLPWPRNGWMELKAVQDKLKTSWTRPARHLRERLLGPPR